MTPSSVNCAVCAKPFAKRNSLQRVCSPRCALKTVREQRKAEKAEYRRRQEAAKPRSQWLKEAQAAFNAWVRARDADKPCICCGRVGLGWSRGGEWDCGHYRSTGSAPHLRFHPNNAHRQLKYCNRYGAGKAVDYRIGLIERIGLPAVEALESDQEPRKYSIQDLKAIRDEYRAKLKILLESST